MILFGVPVPIQLTRPPRSRCACGCGRVLGPTGPSEFFADQRCQTRWHYLQRLGRPAGPGASQEEMQWQMEFCPTDVGDCETPIPDRLFVHHYCLEYADRSATALRSIALAEARRAAFREFPGPWAILPGSEWSGVSFGRPGGDGWGSVPWPDGMVRGSVVLGLRRIPEGLYPGPETLDG